MTTPTDALAERLFGATLGALELFSVHLGWRLGLYEALAGGAPCTPDELAARCGIDARYAREWLEQQAVAGFLSVDDPAADPARYSMPPGHAEVLAQPEHPAHVAPFAPMVVGIGGALPEVVAAYRSGEGVPYSRYGADFRDGQGAINRPAFVHDLAGWLAAVPALAAPSRIADVGCGQGWSTLALADAFPRARVTGYDLDEASVRDATRLAGERGADVGFEVRQAAELDPGSFDLVCVFEALHDMAHPVDVLDAVRRALTPEGVALVVDERVADAFVAPGDEVERMMYGWSVTHCLPASRMEPGSAALGTVLRAATVRRLATEAGFSGVEVLPVEHDFFRLYLLRG